MKLFARRRCDNCKHYDKQYALTGLCPRLGVLTKRGESILDGVDVFNKLNVNRVEYRNPIVRAGFACTYWSERKR